ncbi:hypothetical protein ACH5RR_001233 [Cinchona calisaya]|uniref:Sulfotransferase n=1 Tax=Cinchona calisaya TaxID=153742 RepID=A0ABD3B404_9GENT
MACEEAPYDETKTRYQELTSTVPAGGNPAEDMYKYQGFWYPKVFLEGIISAQDNFKAKPTDIILCSAPKTGFTWLKALCYAIVTRTLFDEFKSPLLSNLSHFLVPFLEIDFAESPPHREPQLPLLSTHLPFTSLPESIKETPCRIIYICREPKDTFVSLWHYLKRVVENTESEKMLKIEDQLDMFCKGKSPWGPYWDHVLGYWTASLEMPEKIMFLKYEDLKNQTPFFVKEIANFMGKPFSVEEELDGLPEKTAKFCNFESMSSLEVNKCEKFRPRGPVEIMNSAFFRKGTVGDWRNYLTSEMIAKLDHITNEKLRGCALEFGSSDLGSSQ